MDTVADHLAAALVGCGVTTGFGIPGGETLWLLESLRLNGIRFVLARHETGAGLMAEGLHHATGEPGLLVATVGPGVANCPNAVAQARLDRVPLVVVTGNVADDHDGRFTHQVFDQTALLAPIVKASFRLRPETAARDIASGLRVMLEGRPGPVHFDLPLDVAEAPCAPWAPTPAMPEAPARLPPEAIDRLARAERPLVLAGLEAVSATSLRPLAERIRAPVLGTYKAIGVLPWDHPLWVAAAGLSPRADDALLPRVKEADVVLLAGYDAVEMRAGWLHPFGDDAFVIDASTTPVPPTEHRTDLRLVGPVEATLAGLLDAVPQSAPRELGAWPEVKRSLAEAFAPSASWGPAGVISAVRDAVSDHTVVTVDTGAHRILLSQMWRAREPRTLLQSSGLCTMGYALPVAVGAAMGTGRPVVAVVGDGGLEMASGELATARDAGVDVTVVVIDDQSLALIEKKQRGRGLSNLGVDYGDRATDFVRLAEAFGAEGRRFSDVAALREWLATPHHGSRLAHCPIPRRAYDGAF